MANRKKPAGTQQGHRPSTALTVIDGDGPQVIPRPPDGLLKGTQEAWAAYWSSSVRGAALEVDVVVVERWILARDEWQRALNAVRRRRVVEGSMGQPVLNPLASWVKSREDELHRCEAELGIGPKSRHNLGITVGQARMTAHELNRLTAEAEDSDDGPEDAVEAEARELLERFQ